MVLKKYQVPGTVPSGKPPKSEPYHTVPCRTMQWKSANSLVDLKVMVLHPVDVLRCEQLSSDHQDGMRGRVECHQHCSDMKSHVSE